MNTKIKETLNNKYVTYGLILLAGLFLGWLIFPGDSSTGKETSTTEHDHDHGEEIWTCSMHPQIRMDKPGKCPLCAMDLIPLKATGSGDATIDPDAIQLSEEAVALANIQTTIVSRQNPVKDIRLYGTIQVDERLSQSQTSHVGGRIEKLMVSFTGESVRKGQTIATIYSPELLSAQQELLEAVKMKEFQPALLEAVREKLSLWKLSEEQIAAIERSGEVSPLIDITANTGGIVVSKNVNQGDYVSTGTILFDIADLSRVWAVFDAYESDLPFLKIGDKLEYTLQSLPGKSFSGKVSFINPILDPNTRTAKVRVETANPRMELMPGMYADAFVNAPLKQYNHEIVIPKSAVLWTGKRSIIYVKQPGTETPGFLLREIELGPSLGDSYVVLSGIEDGDEIVTKGAFTIDASAQLAGKRSMMNNETGHAITGHEGHSMQEGNNQAHKQVPDGHEHGTITVQGLCEMCKDRIEKTAMGVKDVSSASWDGSTKQLHLHFNPTQTSLDKISEAIAKVGHDTDRHKADQKVYDALPGCCKYRK
ncbi:efflux RND transporter periplasmic adaptor subunit [Proteiniphilum sp.]|uniref:efflux RND transporter periplasmic adaptor subunit n=1 Tax=Proteiniphilum sp. TaxID=1926877 RepID=UPI002B1EF15D|nr:efflux RND transporter periplasmic adaptor subunit [Proteiniphilum sp.]MEA4918001.1 efflux RND transporter periplasmic adaptor subunit [Proteiniphilum sp.]